MVKDYTHDYAVSAFAFYAHCGCPSDEDMHAIIRKWAEKNHDSTKIRNRRRKRRLLTEEDLIREKSIQMENLLECYIADAAAINRMLEVIKQTSAGDDKLKCIKYVYFNKNVNLKARGNMSSLVQRCVMETGLNESFIYRSLKLARDVFMWQRGLRSNIPAKIAEQVFGFAL